MAQEVRVKLLSAVNASPSIPPIVTTDIETQINNFLVGKQVNDIISVNAQGFSQYGSITGYMAVVVYKVSV